MDLTDLPKYDSKFKPDFMAPGPRVILDQGHVKVDEDDDAPNEDEDLDQSPAEPVSVQYYRSDKILGKLYRAIDEESFLASIQVDARTSSAARKGKSILSKLWLHVERQSRSIDWKSHCSWARGIKEW